MAARSDRLEGRNTRNTGSREQPYVKLAGDGESGSNLGHGDEIELQSLQSLESELDLDVDVNLDEELEGRGLAEVEGVGIDESETLAGENGHSSMRMAFMNMANSILGAGIIGQPFAFRNTGMVAGILVMVVLTVLIDWTLRLIVKNAELSGTRSYQDTVYSCFGLQGKILLLFSISSFAYGGCMAFCVIIGDTIPHVLKAFMPKSITDSGSVIGWLFHRNTIIVIFTTCISYPLSLNRDISKLAKASAFALFGMFIIVVITIIRAPFVDESLKTALTRSDWTVNTNIFQGISVVSFALVCHHNTIFIYNSLKNATVAKFAKLTHIACFVSMIFCSVMAINGFLTFGSNVKGNILNNFKSDDKLVNVARFCFGLNMLTTFPLEIFVVRDVLKDIILSSKDNSGTTAHLELSSKQHFTITTILVFTSMSVSLVTCNLGIILELIGATSASLMAYIIPPSCYLKLSWDHNDFKSLEKQERKRFIMSKLIPCVGCVVFGFLIMIISSYMSISSSLKSGGGSDHCVID